MILMEELESPREQKRKKLKYLIKIAKSVEIKILLKKIRRGTKLFKILSQATFILLHFLKSRMVWPQNAKNWTTNLKLNF
jgi:hypothetical protein